MLNYVAILLLGFLYTGPWKDKQGYGFPGTASFKEIAALPRLPTGPWAPGGCTSVC